MEKIRIRNVGKDDSVACHIIEAACFSTSEAASKEKISKRIEIFPEGFLIAEIDETIVGFINSGSCNKDDLSDEELKDMVGHNPEGENIIIFSLAVHPDYQGKKVSSHLLTEFLLRARKMNKTQVLLLCKNHLINYYKKFDFIDDGESSSTHGGYYWHQMSLVL
jgi:ribosomal protein S18 acetylase RimI-like enzyme